jgi:hypothetical protein
MPRFWGRAVLLTRGEPVEGPGVAGTGAGAIVSVASSLSSSESKLITSVVSSRAFAEASVVEVVESLFFLPAAALGLPIGVVTAPVSVESVERAYEDRGVFLVLVVREVVSGAPEEISTGGMASFDFVTAS